MTHKSGYKSVSHQDKDILIEISACIENLMTARAEMLQNI
jgi:hypothetical protein